jgi:CspA family cold shock protein
LPLAATQRRLHKRTETMASGTVKWFNAQKGYGFIQPDEKGADVFVHISAVERAGMHELREGQKIVFDIVADRRTGRSSAREPPRWVTCYEHNQALDIYVRCKLMRSSKA